MSNSGSNVQREAGYDQNVVEVVADAAAGQTAVDGAREASWKILVVDDDADVHAATRFALKDARVLGRKLELIEAHNLRQAQDALLQSDFAVILLDVVMEHHDSGLRFAQWVREAGLADVRIILRTGQPGFAPELAVIRDFDINDYRAKSELTQAGLITSITAAIRSFQQIETSERNRRGLEMILSSCSALFQHRNLPGFAHGVLVQLSSLCDAHGRGLICKHSPGEAMSDARIVSGLGPLAAHLGQNVSNLPIEDALRARILSGYERVPPCDEDILLIPFDTRSGPRFLAALKPSRPLDSVDAALVQVFVASVTAGFERTVGHA
jgi:CheY-like chemotaxis protein